MIKFLNWIPLGYVFETKLISTLIYKFLNVPVFRNVTLSCLTEIGKSGFEITKENHCDGDIFEHNFRLQSQILNKKFN